MGEFQAAPRHAWMLQAPTATTVACEEGPALMPAFTQHSHAMVAQGERLWGCPLATAAHSTQSLNCLTRGSVCMISDGGAQGPRREVMRDIISGRACPDVL